MRKIKIIVDSTCDLEKEILEKYDIETVPLGISFKDECYFDGVDLTTERLYELVKDKKMLPKTFAPSIGTFMQVFKKYIDQDYDIIFIAISSDFSSCYQNACVASEDYKDRIVCIDSRNLSSGIGLIILKACKYRQENKTIHEIETLLKEKIIPNVRSQFIIDTFDYLYKGGRCSSLSYFFGKSLHIHPIILVKDGKMIVYKKPRGKMINGLNELIEIFKKDLDVIDEDTVMITHSLAPEYEKYLHTELKKYVKDEIIMPTHAGCVVSSHCGRGTIGILYIKK